MTFMNKTLAVLLLVIGTIFATGCASVGGAASDPALGDILTERKVTQALFAEPDLTDEDIIVSCVGGVVTLSGTVESSIEKELAERVASGVAGVTEVNNTLLFDT